LTIVYYFYIRCPEQLHEKSVHREVKSVPLFAYSLNYSSSDNLIFYSADNYSHRTVQIFIQMPYLLFTLYQIM